MSEIEMAKRWFGDGEVDVDLMIACGAITEESILRIYRNAMDDPKEQIEWDYMVHIDVRE